MMNRSQRGAARVNIVWLIVLLVGMLVSIAFGFVANDEAAQMEADAEQARQRENQAQQLLNEANETIRDISEIAGFYDETSASARSEPDSMKEGLQSLRNNFSDMDPSVVTSFQKAVDIAVRNYNQRGAEISQLKGDIDQLRTEITAKEAEIRTLGQSTSTQISALESQLADAEQAASDRQTDLEGQVASARDSLRETDSQLRTARNTIEEDQRSFSQEGERYKTRLREQGRKLDFMKAPTAADGEVLAVSKDLGLGWIDVGSNNRLARGTRFRVVDGRTGSTRIKAWCEVTKVNPDTAEVMFTNQTDIYNPVVTGDIIYNPIYDPRGGRDAILVGRFSGTYNEKELSLLLDEMGINVQEKLDERTDYLILGSEIYVDEDGEPLEEPTQPTDLPEYKEAEAKGVVVVPLKQIREYFRK